MSLKQNTQSTLYINIGHAYRSERPNISDLQVAEENYLAGLVMSEREEVAIIMYCLSAMLVTLFTRTSALNFKYGPITFGRGAIEMASEANLDFQKCADNLCFSLL
jgi:hypothetical protein